MPSRSFHQSAEDAAALLEKNDGSALLAYKQILADHLDILKAQFQSGITAGRLVHARADKLDEILCSIWKKLFREASEAIALVAVGGYGRGELHPKSDVDLLLITENANVHHAKIEQFLALLWDLKLDVGHSVRTIAECASEAEKDVTVLTSLLESRLLAGSLNLFKAMRNATAESRIWSKRDFLKAKLTEQQQRHKKSHGTAYRLEPNIKEGPGGLRDIQTIAWVAKRYFGVEKLADLPQRGFLTDEEFNELLQGREYLWRIRFALHILTGRREDRLLFENQRELASMFGFKGDDHNLAIEQFMQSYYRTVTDLERLNEMLLQLLQEAIEYPDNNHPSTILDEHFQITHAYLDVQNENIFAEYPTGLLKAFLLMMQHPELKGVRASTIRLIRQNSKRIDDNFRRNPVNRGLFMQMLQAPKGVTREFKRMNRYGILAAYLPVFENIVGRMQYDLFHIYTVDLHTIFVIRNIRRFSVPKHAGWQPLCSEIFPTLSHPENLYIAALFHDIAKGRGGDHSELGAIDVMNFCRNHGMSEGNTKITRWLVRMHLLMSMTAQRKDINDPTVIHEFATHVGDMETLNYLYLLTIADISATNPELLTSWKEQLLLDLYNRTKQALRQGLAKPLDIEARIQERQTNAGIVLKNENLDANHYEEIWRDFDDDYFLQHSADEIAWHTRAILNTPVEALPLISIRQETKRGSSAIFIYALENDGFFAISANTLSKLGLNVVDARIITSKSGYTLDTYMVLDYDHKPICDNFRVQEIKIRLSVALSNPSALNEIKRRPLPRQLQFFKTDTLINFDNDHENHYTLVSIQTLDRPGLLAHIGQAFVESRTRIHNAKISTLGERADNIFTITDHANQAIIDPEIQAEIKQKLLLHIDGK